MTSDELRNWATVLAALVALLVFFVNSFLQMRSRRIENISRFIEAHDRLFESRGYILSNIGALESGTLVRDRSDPAMEAKFHAMLIEVEHLAILANNNAVPRHTQVYMFGWYAGQILTVVSDKERSAMAWELALHYLDGLARDTAAYQSLRPDQRRKYWR